MARRVRVRSGVVGADGAAGALRELPRGGLDQLAVLALEDSEAQLLRWCGE